MIKAVIDTQIIARAIISINPSSNAARIVRLASAGKFLAVTSSSILLEVKRVLGVLKHPEGGLLSDEEIQKAIGFLRKKFLIVPGHYKLRQIVPQDADDNPLFESAIEAGASFVVTEDKDVLEIKSLSISGYQKIEVVPPSTFLAITSL